MQINKIIKNLFNIQYAGKKPKKSNQTDRQRGRNAKYKSPTNMTTSNTGYRQTVQRPVKGSYPPSRAVLSKASIPAPVVLQPQGLILPSLLATNVKDKEYESSLLSTLVAKQSMPTPELPIESNAVLSSLLSNTSPVIANVRPHAEEPLDTHNQSLLPALLRKKTYLEIATEAAEAAEAVNTEVKAIAAEAPAEARAVVAQIDDKDLVIQQVINANEYALLNYIRLMHI
jgi:hypothetical protein